MRDNSISCLRVFPEVWVVMDYVEVGGHGRALGHDETAAHVRVLRQDTSCGADGREEAQALLDAVLEVLQRLQVLPSNRNKQKKPC